MDEYANKFSIINNIKISIQLRKYGLSEHLLVIKDMWTMWKPRYLSASAQIRMLVQSWHSFCIEKEKKIRTSLQKKYIYLGV